MTTRENNIGELRGLIANAKANKQNVAIIKVPVYMMAIDESYQTADRTERKLNYLTSRWDERKIGVLTVVPHEDEGLFYIVDGYGRWKASQIVDKEKYTTLDCAVLLNVPTEVTERRKFEAELFANQNRDVAKLKPVEKHGAMQVLGDPAALALDELQSIYGFTIGKRKRFNDNTSRLSINGIYACLCSGIRAHGKEIGEWFFDICQRSGFNTKTYGYSRYIYKSLRDMYIAFPSERDKVADTLVKYFRPITPHEFKAEAVIKYPKLNEMAACSMHAEDIIAEHLGLKHTRKAEGDRIVQIILP